MATTDETPVLEDIDRGASLQAAYWSMFAIASVFFLLRVWARCIKRIFVAEDALLAAGWICLLTAGILLHHGVSHGGARHFIFLSPEQKLLALKLQFIVLVIGIASTTFGKVAVGLTILRIVSNTTAHNWKKTAVLITMVLTVSCSIIDILLLTFQCRDPRVLWDLEIAATAQCVDKRVPAEFNTFTAAFHTFTDFFYSFLAMIIVWGLNMSLKKRLSLMAVLGLTIVTGIACAFKTHLSAKLVKQSGDRTWDPYDLYIWAGVEAMLILVCGSIPALRPLWQLFRGQGYGYKYDSSGYAARGGGTKLVNPRENNNSTRGMLYGTKSHQAQVTDTELGNLATLGSPTPRKIGTPMSTENDDISGSLEGIQVVTEVNVTRSASQRGRL
ncbi:hypothetical protein QBC35DRAFT_508616 [Podospora australis]|uniref:Rhodopsin domain-containing protein n=1 Tax=Podospora australis TaxID=1536484 RepID=A0AAN7AEN6_9PEZI|nr:hypothetical protein QBC35DRAFT_508616 [Podospora australis]